MQPNRNGSSTTVRIWGAASARLHSYAVPLDQCQHLAVELEEQPAQDLTVVELPVKRRRRKNRE